MHYIIVCFVFLLLSLQSFGQNRRSLSGFFPEAQISYKTNKDIKLTAKIESQHGMIQNTPNSEADVNYFHSLTDFQGFVGGKISPFISIAGGYQYRVASNRPNSHRSMQQISFLQKKSKIRINHRVRLDQTFADKTFPEFRARYRLALEIALDGKNLDPGEFYLVLSDEGIYSYQSDEANLENRAVISLGHFFTNKQKLEAGIDYRIDGFINHNTRHRTWLKVGWFINI